MKTKTKRTFIRLTAAAFLAAVLFPVFAAAQETKVAPPATKERPGRMLVREALDLTPDQEKALAELRQTRMAERKAYRDEMSKLRQELGELAKDPKSDQARIDALIDKTARLRAEREKAGFRNRDERNKIFTPEQLEKMKSFRARLANRPGRSGQGPAGLGRMGLRGPGRSLGPRSGLRGMARLRALRLRRFLRGRR
jgi:Spy/CpxP family protein refolding chaperone